MCSLKLKQVQKKYKENARKKIKQNCDVQHTIRSQEFPKAVYLKHLVMSTEKFQQDKAEIQLLNKVYTLIRIKNVPICRKPKPH